MPGTEPGPPPALRPTPSTTAVRVLLDEAAPLIDAFVEAGHRIYLVGGIVRDLLVGRVDGREADLDFTTDATPPRIKHIIGPIVDAVWTQGERFGTIGAKVGDRTYEITTHRAETYRDDSRKPEVRFSQAVTEDLSRRDFTVNAMAIDGSDGALVDPHGGAADLAAGILRTPLDPEISFADDPLRMLRAARFVAGYDLEASADVVTAMTAMSQRMTIVSIERIRDELDKLLTVPAAASGLALLARTGLLAYLLPWLESATPEVADTLTRRLDRIGHDPTARLAVLVADPDPAVVQHRLRDLRHSSARTNAITATVAAATALTTAPAIDAPWFRRWYATVAAHADAARAVAAALEPAAAPAIAASRRLEAELAPELDDLGPPLSARQIMSELGLQPGPQVGDAIDYLTELRFEHGPLDETAARAALHRWAETRA